MLQVRIWTVLHNTLDLVVTPSSAWFDILHKSGNGSHNLVFLWCLSNLLLAHPPNDEFCLIFHIHQTLSFSTYAAQNNLV
jgi:hypothetical protein